MPSTDETRPLLSPDDDVEVVPCDLENRKLVLKTTPLPKKELFILCCIRFSEPVSYNLIFPFINEMIQHLGIGNPGYTSGLVEGIFAFAQLCTVFYWGSLSDRIGRRPVLLMGLLGIAVFTILFGFSTSFLALLLTRFMIGACNGNVAVIKSAIAEMTDETNAGRAFSFLPLSWSVGTIIAPLIGGFLARPAEQHPRLFGKWKLLIDYPYLLPCIAGASVTLVAWVVGYFFLDETLGGLDKHKLPEQEQPLPSSASSSSATATDYGSTSDPTSGATPSPGPVRMSAKEIFADTIIRRILVSYVFFALVTVSIHVVIVLWLYMPVDQGGCGFTTSQIGVILFSEGAFGTFINLVVFPPLQRRIGTLLVYRSSMQLNVVLVALFPAVSKIAELEGMSKLGGVSKLGTKIGVGLIIGVKCIAGMVFASNMILVSRSAPSRTSLGAINGVAQMVASSTRAIGPAVATFIFAVSTDPKYHFLGGQLVWIYMFGLALLAVWMSLEVQEGRDEEQN